MSNAADISITNKYGYFVSVKIRQYIRCDPSDDSFSGSVRNISTLERVGDIIEFEVFGELGRNNSFKSFIMDIEIRNGAIVG